ncbi:MAG: Zn-dependent hydrolase [Bacteroidales bacterium]|nr:Zn-dependent hydrolase [Bacteroidales bacterium]
MIRIIIGFVAIAVLAVSCDTSTDNQKNITTEDTIKPEVLSISDRLHQYAEVELTTDISAFSATEKELLKHLIDACNEIDNIFWIQSTGKIKDSTLVLAKTPEEKEYCIINYGPWDRIRDNEPFIEGVGKKPIGAGFYPHDIKYFPFIDMKFEDKLSMFTVIKRADDGSLYTEPYHKAYAPYLKKAAEKLEKAATLSTDKNFAKFLKLRAQSLLNDDYYTSDVFWLENVNSKIDIVIGPTDFEEDKFINTKASFTAYLLIKDFEWSNKFESISHYLPSIKETLPLPDNFKNQIVISTPNIGVYDAIFYAGWGNGGPKQISINHPKDGRIIMEKGSRKLQFKNSQKAKFDKILKPIADILIDSSERNNVKYEGFFINNVSYEIADAIVVKTTINGKGPVKDALKDYFPTINSLKADILSMYILTKLQEKKLISDVTLLDNYVVFVSNIIRSVRFGAAFSQGSSNLIAFNMLHKMKAFERNPKTGTYKINFEKMKDVIQKIAKDILTVMLEGDYATAKSWVDIYGNMSDELQNDVKKISKAGIPIDIKFKQGKEVLGLN